VGRGNDTGRLEKEYYILYLKKRDKLTCSNYRGISLLPTSYKILIRMLKKRLESYIEKIIGEYQSGFRPNRSTVNHLFTLRQITEKCWEYNIDIYLCFIDFKQAYDTIIRKKLRMIMSTFGIPTKLSRIINLTMTETINQVKIQNQLTEYLMLYMEVLYKDIIYECYIYKCYIRHYEDV
jgi:sorting nexin-29